MDEGYVGYFFEILTVLNGRVYLCVWACRRIDKCERENLQPTTYSRQANSRVGAVGANN